MRLSLPSLCSLLCTLALTPGAAMAAPIPAQGLPVRGVTVPAATEIPAPRTYERQAALAWDGTDTAAPDPQEARRLLGLAIEGYRAQAAAQPRDMELGVYISHLEKVQGFMESFADFDAAAVAAHDKDLEGFHPSYVALELLALPDTSAAGLRHRLACIIAYLERDRGRYLLSELAAPDLAYMELRAAEPRGKDYLGLTSWFSDATSFGARMEFYMANMPPAGQADDAPALRLAKDLRRALIVNDTLVHELTHVYFCSRYPKISRGEEDDIRRIYEGHAMSTAYAFVRDAYFRGDLTPERYEKLMLSPRYTRYFRWYRADILTPEGAVQWGKLDAAELRSATPGYYVRTRKPHKGMGLKARPFRYFGRP